MSTPGTPAAAAAAPATPAAASAATDPSAPSATPRRRRINPPPTTHHHDDGEKEVFSMVGKVLKGAGISLLILLLLLVFALIGIFSSNVIRWAMRSNFPSTPATTSVVGVDGLTEAQALAAGSASTAPAAVEKELANGEHIGGGREFVKTANGFGLLCFKNNRQICWMNEGDDITAGNPGEGVTVLKVDRKEIERHGIAVKGETTEGSFTFVAVPNATVKSWRTVP